MSDFNDAMAPPPAYAGESNQEDRTLALLTHLSGVITSIIVPLIVWLIHKDKPDKGFLNDQAKEALNFQITMLIGYVIGAVLTIVLIGPLISLATWIASLVFSILAGIKANEGVAYRYPFALRLIK